MIYEQSEPIDVLQRLSSDKIADVFKFRDNTKDPVKKLRVPQKKRLPKKEEPKKLLKYKSEDEFECKVAEDQNNI
jgi:hypothetical protein